MEVTWLDITTGKDMLATPVNGPSFFISGHTGEIRAIFINFAGYEIHASLIKSLCMLGPWAHGRHTHNSQFSRLASDGRAGFYLHIPPELPNFTT